MFKKRHSIEIKYPKYHIKFKSKQWSSYVCWQYKKRKQRHANKIRAFSIKHWYKLIINAKIKWRISKTNNWIKYIMLRTTNENIINSWSNKLIVIHSKKNKHLEEYQRPRKMLVRVKEKLLWDAIDNKNINSVN